MHLIRRLGRELVALLAILVEERHNPVNSTDGQTLVAWAEGERGHLIGKGGPVVGHESCGPLHV